MCVCFPRSLPPIDDLFTKNTRVIIKEIFWVDNLSGEICYSPEKLVLQITLKRGCMCLCPDLTSVVICNNHYHWLRLSTHGWLVQTKSIADMTTRKCRHTRDTGLWLCGYVDITYRDTGIWISLKWTYHPRIEGSEPQEMNPLAANCRENGELVLVFKNPLFVMAKVRAQIKTLASGWDHVRRFLLFTWGKAKHIPQEIATTHVSSIQKVSYISRTR